MKTLKLTCAALAAALLLASCGKDETPAGSQNYKSVEVVISNVKMGTKAGGTASDLNQQKIQLNSLQFFFSDGVNFHAAKTAEATAADTYLNTDELNQLGGNLTLSFHYLPTAVKEVIVIGNLDELNVTQKTDLDRTLYIGENQDVTKFPLYAEAEMTTMVEKDHETGNDAHITNVYKVNLNVVPCVARFEIKQIGCNFTSTNKKYVVKSMAFTDFYSSCDFRSGDIVASSYQTVAKEQQPIFNYFNNVMDKANWNNDFFDAADANHPEVELTPANNLVDVNIAYNFFCNGATAPAHLFNIFEYVTNPDASVTANPTYLYTNTYKKNGTTAITTFEPGKIYRMNVVFGEDNLTYQDRCLDITVEVASWEVIEVTPGF